MHWDVSSSYQDINISIYLSLSFYLYIYKINALNIYSFERTILLCTLEILTITLGFVCAC